MRGFEEERRGCSGVCNTERKIETGCRRKKLSVRKHVIEKDMFLKNMKFFDSVSDGKKRRESKKMKWNTAVSAKTRKRKESSLMINGFWT